MPRFTELAFCEQITKEVEQQLNAEYFDYCEDCELAQEKPWNFQDWFSVCYHYDLLDNQ